MPPIFSEECISLGKFPKDCIEDLMMAEHLIIRSIFRWLAKRISKKVLTPWNYFWMICRRNCLKEWDEPWYISILEESRSKYFQEEWFYIIIYGGIHGPFLECKCDRMNFWRKFRIHAEICNRGLRRTFGAILKRASGEVSERILRRILGVVSGGRNSWVTLQKLSKKCSEGFLEEF